MPNWCQNEVTVAAETKGVLDKFKTFVKGEGTEFSCQSILPMPRELQGTRSPAEICTDEEYHKWIAEHQPTYDFQGRPITKKMSDRFKLQYGTDNWYDWCTANWGTKWDISDVDVIEDDTSVKYFFDTAWSPPEGVYSALVEKFPEVEISWFYREEGMQFAGYLSN